MREIKFRAWDKDMETMVYSNELMGHIEYDTNPVNTINIILNEDDYGLDFMQYTGLNDKNGKEIYEGDILQFYNDVDYILKPSYAEVIFEDGSFCAKHFKYGTEHLANLDVSDMDITVAGNIYEHKHLLGEI